MQSHQDDQPESQDWLVTYSDLMSLLLCCFVMLYALSTVKEASFQSATESLRSGFGLFGKSYQSSKASSEITGQKIGGTILFEQGSEDLTDSARQELNEIYRQLLHTSDKVQIVGQAWEKEPSSYRREFDLAYARAVNVWEHLVSLGMLRERCEIVQQIGESTGALVEIRCVR